MKDDKHKNIHQPTAGLEPAALRLRVSRSNQIELRRLTSLSKHVKYTTYIAHILPSLIHLVFQKNDRRSFKWCHFNFSSLCDTVHCRCPHVWFEKGIHPKKMWTKCNVEQESWILYPIWILFLSGINYFWALQLYRHLAEENGDFFSRQLAVCEPTA